VQRKSINLTFHGVGERERDAEPGEERTWLDLDCFNAVLDSVMHQPEVQLSFDDGNASDVIHGLPALLRRGLRANFFVVAGRLGAPEFLDDGGVRALADAGMTIGCHGMRHRPWRRLGDDALREELVDARKILEAVVGRPVTEAACPFGSYDRRVLGSLRRSGYRHVYTSDRGTSHPHAWLQPRNSVQSGEGAGVVDEILSSERSAPRALLRQLRLSAKRWR
jgi:peptidoglycan/xylan/chitin deacetylase (PgdA/CDA1 family)